MKISVCSSIQCIEKHSPRFAFVPLQFVCFYIQSLQFFNCFAHFLCLFCCRSTSHSTYNFDSIICAILRWACMCVCVLVSCFVHNSSFFWPFLTLFQSRFVGCMLYFHYFFLSYGSMRFSISKRLSFYITFSFFITENCTFSAVVITLLLLVVLKSLCVCASASCVFVHRFNGVLPPN